MEEYPGGAIITMKAKDQKVEAMEEEAQGGELLLLSLGGTRVPLRGNHSRGDRLHQHHLHHHHHHLFYAVHSPAPRCNTYLNMVLYATYYDPMMCCHPMMF